MRVVWEITTGLCQYGFQSGTSFTVTESDLCPWKAFQRWIGMQKAACFGWTQLLLSKWQPRPLLVLKENTCCALFLRKELKTKTALFFFIAKKEIPKRENSGFFQNLLSSSLWFILYTLTHKVDCLERDLRKAAESAAFQTQNFVFGMGPKKY